MYFLDNNSGIATMPPLKETQSTTPLWFTEGDGHKGISWPGEDWFNIQQAEQLALLKAAGIRPDKGKLNQLTLAIRAIIGQEALLKTQALAEIAAAGKTAQEKARTHLGLGKLATQDGIQEATLHRKGIVQLNSAPRSADETTAATPKAVNDRVNAVVDNAPSDLDTLNKLAQAISNNPKFAENVMQLLSQKLVKNENGADIPDKNQFIKNLGLLETIDCAKNALDKRTGGTVNGGVTFGQNLTISWGGRTATYHENGDITGPAWGGALSGWINARANEAQSNAWQHADHVANGRATWDYVNTTFVRDIRLGHMQEIQIWRGTGYRDEPHYVITGVYNGNVDAYVDYVQRRILQKNVNGNWINVWFM